MGKSDGGLLLILFALFALWLYNTGRATAILAVVKDPNYKGTSSTQAPVKTSGGATVPGQKVAGGITTGSISQCAAVAASGSFDPSCAGIIQSAINDPVGAFKQVLNAVDPLSIFGLKI